MKKRGRYFFVTDYDLVHSPDLTPDQLGHITNKTALLTEVGDNLDNNIGYVPPENLYFQLKDIIRKLI